MIPRNRLTSIVWGAAIIWAILLVVNGVAFSTSWFSQISKVIGILVILIGFYEKWLWRISVFHPWLVSTPVLQGTWKGELRSSYKDPKTGQAIPPIEAYLVIKQTFSTISMRLMTCESSSESITNVLRQRDDDGTYSLAGMYCNTPIPSLSDKNPMHRGSVVFNIIEEKEPLLDGEYWTNRLTKGSIRFDQRMNKQIRDYRMAVDAFRKKSSN